MMEYKVVHLTLKDDRKWEEMLNALGREGWGLSGVVPLIEVGFSGAATTKGAQFVFMRAAPAGQNLGPR